MACFIVMLTLCTGCGRNSTSTPPGATAEVTSDKATFTIPVEKRSVWHWHVKSTPFDAFEYSWEVSPKGISEISSFGLSVWKNGNQSPEQGNLSQLIRAGQGSIWAPTPAGGGRLIGNVTVTATRQDSAVEITLVEQPVVKEFLQKRPPLVEIVTRTLDMSKPHYSVAEQRYSVAVSYPDR
jgi:voltage-gated potassium channel Kch